jgi:pimeloyl-ACP methyl ester carboxylesterase
MCKFSPTLFAIAVAIFTAVGLFGGWGHAAEPSGRMRVTVTGQGPDVILIPGLASSGAVWDGTVKALSATHRVHVVQVAGFAGAPVAGNAEGPIVEPLVEAINGYIVSARLKSPAVIGHSMGGFTGLLLAQRHPDHVGRLLVVDSLPFFSALMSPTATVESVRPQAAAMRDAIAAMDAATFESQQAMTLPRMVSRPRV